MARSVAVFHAPCRRIDVQSIEALFVETYFELRSHFEQCGSALVELWNTASTYDIFVPPFEALVKFTILAFSGMRSVTVRLLSCLSFTLRFSCREKGHKTCVQLS